MTKGEVLGTNIAGRKMFFYALAWTGVIVAQINTLSVITQVHHDPVRGLIKPIVWEGSSWLSLMLFFWIPWLAYRFAPPLVRPHWRLLLHIPAALAFSFCHVTGFILIRTLAYLTWSEHYDFGPPGQNFAYEFSKDSLGYVLGIASFTVITRILRRPPAPPARLTFDIRDGAKFNRVMLDDILAVASAGNYTEFKLRDGRLLCMRSSLSALEDELSPLGFVRTHRSWLVNVQAVTALKPEGSGDYSVELGSLRAPLSRRYPKALAALRKEV